METIIHKRTDWPTVEEAIDWLHEKKGAVRFHVLEIGDAKDEVNVCTVSLSGKTGCRVTRREFLDAVGVAMIENVAVAANIAQLELAL